MDDYKEIGRKAGNILWGPLQFEKMEKYLDEISPTFHELDLKVCSYFLRPDLEIKTRILCVIAAVSVLGYPQVLRLLIFGALNNNITSKQIEEVILQTGQYGGALKLSESLAVFRKSIEEWKPKA